MRDIILASQSPRRRELLERMGVAFRVVPSNFNEVLDDGRDPAIVAKELGLGKALEVASRFPDAIVIGSDTLVSVGGKQLGKPRDINEAREMLRMLSGRSSQVTTSVAIVCIADKIETVEAASTTVTFKPRDDKAIEAYLKSGDWHDKAGAYGIQSGAAPLISHIKGPYDSVVGLPTQLLARLLTSLGVPATAVKLKSPIGQL